MEEKIIIRVYGSRYSPDEKDMDYYFIQWIANNETIIAICEDIASGQIFQFKLNDYIMKFKQT